MTTKVQQIMKLYDGKRTTREIADIVGCMTNYVRVVARQRKGTGASKFDRAYDTPERRKKINDKTAARRRAYYKALSATGCKKKARAAYHAAPLVEVSP